MHRKLVGGSLISPRGETPLRPLCGDLDLMEIPLCHACVEVGQSGSLRAAYGAIRCSLLPAGGASPRREGLWERVNRPRIWLCIGAGLLRMFGNE